MLNTMVRVVADVGTDPLRISAPDLNTELTTAGLVLNTTFINASAASEAVVYCDPVDEATVRNVIAAHIVNTVTREAAKAAKAQAALDNDALIKQDAQLAAIRAMTPAEYDAWWAASVTNQAQLNGVVKRLVRLAVRRLF